LFHNFNDFFLSNRVGNVSQLNSEWIKNLYISGSSIILALFSLKSFQIESFLGNLACSQIIFFLLFSAFLLVELLDLLFNNLDCSTSAGSILKSFLFLGGTEFASHVFILKLDLVVWMPDIISLNNSKTNVHTFFISSTTATKELGLFASTSDEFFGHLVSLHSHDFAFNFLFNLVVSLVLNLVNFFL